MIGLWLTVALAQQGHEGLTPLALGRSHVPAARCGRCHEAEHEAWSGSRHAVAHTNALYQAGLVAETSSFCVNCHAPTPEQAASVDLDYYRSLDPRRGLDPLPRPDEGLADEGVGCVACHVRDGQIRGVSAMEGAHTVVADPGLVDGTLCRDCHEFRMPAMTGTELVLTDEPMQSTWSEWVRWTEGGGAERCVDCHMPGGQHSFPGAYSARVDEAVRVEPICEGDRGLRLQTDGIGHHFPTGDLFRNLTVEVWREEWQVLARLGRTYAVDLDLETLDPVKRLTADTSLRPGVPVDVAVSGEQPVRWRLVFHYGAPEDDLRGMVPADQLHRVLIEGLLRCDAGG